MAVTDLHSLDISTAIDRIFDGGEARGAVLSLIDETPSINVGQNVPLVMSGRAKGALVHEGGAKPDNGRKVIPKPFTTVKLVYSQRVTDEFMMWDRERQGDFVSRLVSDWTRKSLPRDIDTVVLHGLDPNTNTLDTNLSDYLTKTGSSIAVPASGTGSTYDSTATYYIQIGAANSTDLYAVRIGLDAFCGVTPEGGSIGLETHLPDFTEAKAVHTGDVELIGGVALKNTKTAAVLRGIVIA